jgi:hypothetical protein
MNLVLKSERLLLRPMVAADVDVETEIGTDPDVMRYVGEVETDARIADNMAKYTRRCAGGCIGVWCVIQRQTNEKLGTAVLLPLPVEDDDTNWDLVVGDDLPDGEIEIGYMLRRSAWRSHSRKRRLKNWLRPPTLRTPPRNEYWRSADWSMRGCAGPTRHNALGFESPAGAGWKWVRETPDKQDAQTPVL